MLPIDYLETHLLSLARSACLHSQTVATLAYGSARFPLRAFAWGEKALPAIYIFAGVHGDEPGSVQAALHLLESLAGGAAPLTRHRLLILPCVNPSGLADGTRANRIGQDVNRQFHADQTQESAAVRQFFDPGKAAALVDLHCDHHAQGFYLFELRQDGIDSLAAPILKTLTAEGFPLEEAPFYAGYIGRRGLFAPTTEALEEFHRRASGLSLAEWGWGNGLPRTYSMEAPKRSGEAPSAAMHLAALGALFAALEA